ncbi:MAG: hypothetical protein KF785_09760 [Gemmatimonadales bacterium]|mgnify:CR=1 FL=1|nr:hypothetical protein [Gemmatimonadales bacterium]
MIVSQRHTQPRRLRIAGIAAAMIIAAGSTGCSPGDLLEVETPDIIDPRAVQSAAGANAVRLGALAQFTTATSGGESLLLLSGLFADEWINGDTFVDRHQFDRRDMLPANTFMATASRNLHRARQSASQAVSLMGTYLPAAPPSQVGELHFVQAFLVNQAAENFCNGLVFSDVAVDGTITYGNQITGVQAFERALGHATDGLAVITGATAADVRIRHALNLTRGRILFNLNRPAEAAAAVAGVPTNYAYTINHGVSTANNNIWTWNNNARRYSVANNEGGNGLNFASAADPRVPVCRAPCPQGGVTQASREDGQQPLDVQQLWPTRETGVALLRGVDARMIEAEAALRAGNAGAALDILNAARATVSLAPLTDAGTAAARLDQMMREKAFWSFGRGQRMGDLRRLVRQYSRPQNTVFPTGTWHKAGGTYGSDVNMPIPQEESNNPNLNGTAACLDRNP